MSDNMKVSNMSDPLNFKLTPGLTLGMGHPVKTRIRRLNMKVTDKFTRLGLCGLIAMSLGLSSAIASTSKMQPMQLRFSPQFTTEQLALIDKQRFAYAEAKDGKRLKEAMDDTFFKLSYKNRFQLLVDDDGEGHMQISLGQGGWPGFPASNNKWLKRSLSEDMKAGLSHIIDKCSSSYGPVYFNSDISEGDADIGKGTFLVECIPGQARTRKTVTEKDLAKAYLASSDLPLAKRQEGFGWRMRFALMYEYVDNNPGATLADDKAACIRINTDMKTQHAFSDNDRKSADHFLSRCADTDYNWIRKRTNLTLAQ